MPRYIEGQIDWGRFRGDLRAYQRREALSGKEMARRLHISGAAYTRYCSGDRTPTSEVFVYALLMLGQDLRTYVPSMPDWAT
ncbi:MULTISPECIES: helix-turn-helix domain-containing protein [Deinococcus]|uniref:Helix-turn-helix domain-containing protein n=1 Tax=Deinococcus rufus TaxID=2136097 RepID=A0ABV7ZB45_9DEIO|nr:helix-turn-helix transcriptional regulator [Deinococcus sp. AB2017081]WQE94651.1 helix-turn-helix transcriptional regulator [Deinococcus sp. AB2017081]